MKMKNTVVNILVIIGLLASLTACGLGQSSLPTPGPAGPTWEFESAGDFEGWVWFNQFDALQVSQGLLSAQSTGNDPFMVSPEFSTEAKALPLINIRMVVSAGTMGQLYFITTSDTNWDEAKSQTFPLNADGDFHIYTLDMSMISGWSGTITRIRLDPTDTQSSVEIDYIRLMSK
jgi:hypothetical protein